MRFAVIATATLIWLVVSLRGVALLPLARSTRVLVALALLPFAQYWFLADRWFGSFANMDMPRWLAIVLGGAYGTLLLLAVLLLLRDVVGLALWPWARGAARTLLLGPRFNAAWLLLGLLLGAWATWQGVKMPMVRTVTVDVAGLPKALDGYRLVQLSDLHVSPLTRRSRIAAIVARVNALQPDLVVITGDFQDGSVALRRPDMEPLQDLRSRDGVLGVPGNHEYYSDYDGWMRTLPELGVHMLVNQHALAHRDGATLAVAGISDIQAAAFGRPTPDLAAALRGIAPGTPTVVLAHRPGDAREIARSGAILMLAGHTHGGQIRGLDLITRAANGGFLSGLYRVGDMALYVSNGTNVWHGLPFRLGRPAEITLLQLHATAAHAASAGASD